MVNLLPPPYWSASKVCRARNELIKKGLLQRAGKSEYKVVDVAPMQEGDAQVKQEVASLKQETAPMQQGQPQNVDNSIVSYKDKYRLVRSDKEYNDIWEENGRPESFTPEDMKWVDENV